MTIPLSVTHVATPRRADSRFADRGQPTAEGPTATGRAPRPSPPDGAVGRRTVPGWIWDWQDVGRPWPEHRPGWVSPRPGPWRPRACRWRSADAGERIEQAAADVGRAVGIVADMATPDGRHRVRRAGHRRAGGRRHPGRQRRGSTPGQLRVDALRRLPDGAAAQPAVDRRPLPGRGAPMQARAGAGSSPSRRSRCANRSPG